MWPLSAVALYIQVKIAGKPAHPVISIMQSPVLKGTLSLSIKGTSI
jgi:hypothetical protein